MAKSNRSTSKKTARSPARPVAKAAKRPVAKAAKRTSASRAAKVNGSPAARAKPKAAKSAPVKATSRSKSKSRIDVKVGSFGGNKPGSFGFGGGMSFLSSKPGSGAAGADVPTTKLTRTKLTAKELRHFRELLVNKRRQLLGDMETMENEALRTETSNLSHLPVHMADMGTDNYEQEFTLSLVDRDRQVVDEIDAALRKIDDKTYGICEGTGQMISKERLEAKPWARYSIEYARHLQRPGVRR